jgi:hypothetical protein
MKNILFIFCILIILFKTETVLSNNKIFNVNNIEINKENSQNKEKLVFKAFKKGFEKLINRLLLEKDYKRVLSTDLEDIKKLISYYQIKDLEENKVKKISVNIFFDKDRMHNFFYEKNILYSDTINTEVIFFPLLIKNKEYFIYNKNYFIENWNNKVLNETIQYTLPIESIEKIQKIESYKDNIFKLDTSEFFKEYDVENMLFAIIEKEENNAKIFLNTKIAGKKLNKTFIISNTFSSNEKFNDSIINEIKKLTRDLIKSQNLIDVRTPSFLNVQIRLNNKSNLIEFNNRIKKIGLINNFYVQQLNKDYVLIKIRYLGRVDKIITKLKNEKMNLELKDGKWQLSII